MIWLVFMTHKSDCSKNTFREFGYQSFSDINQLLKAVDVVDIVTPHTRILSWQKSTQNDYMFLEKQSLQLLNRRMNWFLAKSKGLLGMVG